LPVIASDTKDWIKCAADDKAALAGCRFDEERARFVVDWIEKYCRLYEGEWAGQPLKLSDWALDATLRLFGWVRWSEKWQRDIRRFRQASIWVAKKNKKSPTLAAWGFYLLAGDGEPGQKVFLAAKDGQQVRQNAARHTMEMLRQSEELDAECVLNRSTMQITHEPSRSTMLPLSSSNSRTQQSKEGLNGCVLVDETHVVDRDFMRIVSRAGISRSEPLQIEVSTAGNNPDGYGKQRFDEAVLIERGELEDQERFVAVYAAPQDLSDEALEADPLRYGKMANPAMGHTVDPDEYLRDYQQSKRTIQGLLDFKMYRLNIWQRSSNPWLRVGDWEKCRLEPWPDLEGRECWAGLDLSRTRDLSALVLCFRGDEPEEGQEREYYLLPFFWLPAERAAEIESEVPVRQWERQGAITLTPGGVTDYGWIETQFAELCQSYNVKELAYDPKFAEETTQAMSEGRNHPDGTEITAGTGVPRILFAQTEVNFAAPTDDFERLTVAGKIRHSGHPVLSWQVGHAMVKQNPYSKAKRIVKPKMGSVQTVDGVVAAIMALARASVVQARPSIDWL
jgi:phage terminase large subunit-like protein